MGIYGNAARKTFIALHHAGAAGTQYNNPAPYAAPYTGCATNGNRYDFVVNGYGTIAVGARYTNPQGCHAITCNCQATGICMLGCFGGCGGSGDIVTLPQGCGVGYVWAETEIPLQSTKLKPHRYCDNARPCGGSYLGTVCCGTQYTNSSSTNDYWSAAGLTLRNDLLTLATNFHNCGACGC